MTVIDQAVRPAVQPSAARATTGRPASGPGSHRRAESRDAYLLRLSLDLQLDALLLVLGASATGREGSGIPWRRWLDEDVELAWELTATAKSAQAALPVTLGTALAEEDGEGVHADLLARYESMCRLLEDLLAAEAGNEAGSGSARASSALTATVDLSSATASALGLVTDPATPQDGPTEGPAWRTHVRAALDRCRSRVAELRAHTGPQAREDAAAAAPAARSHGLRAAFLPGELLG